MQETVLVVGAGHAGAQVVVQLREQGFQGKILLVGDETSLPYQRPPLSKQYLKGEFETKRLFFRPKEFYEDKCVELLLGSKVKKIDTKAQLVYLESEQHYHYDKCIIATGSAPRKLDVPGSQMSGIHYLRTLEDTDAIKRSMEGAKKLLICGGGYIGLEVAAIAREKQLDVTVIEMAPSLLARVAPAEIAQFYMQMHRAAGVNVETQKMVTSFEGDDCVTKVNCNDGSSYDVDMVLVAIGVIPSVELLEGSGINVDNGIVVDAQCQTSQANVFAIGDCAVHFNDLYQRPLRLESVQNALGQAKVVAANICGTQQCYSELPWFWSDQYGYKLQIAGLHEGYDQVVLRGTMESKKFAHFYLKEGVIIATYAINEPQSFMFSKKLIAEQVKVDPKVLADTTVTMKEIAG